MDPLLQKVAEERVVLRTRIKNAHEVIRESEERLSKLDELQELATELFGASATDDVTIRSGLAAAPLLAAVAVKSGSVRVTKKEAILTGAESILSDGRRRTSKELVEELKTYGVEIGGIDPANNLAAYLSPEKERFDSDRSKGGWGLVLRDPKKANPTDVGASAGLFGSTTGASQPHRTAG